MAEVVGPDRERQSRPLKERPEGMAEYVGLTEPPALRVSEYRAVRPVLSVGQHCCAVLVQSVDGKLGQRNPPATLGRFTSRRVNWPLISSRFFVIVITPTEKSTESQVSPNNSPSRAPESSHTA